MAVSLKTVNFKSTDLFVIAKLATPTGSVCGELPVTSLSNVALFNLSIPVTGNCSLPGIVVSIQDKDGKVLDTMTTSVIITEIKTESPVINKEIKKTNINSLYYGTGVLLIALISIAWFIIRRKRMSSVVV